MQEVLLCNFFLYNPAQKSVKIDNEEKLNDCTLLSCCLLYQFYILQSHLHTLQPIIAYLVPPQVAIFYNPVTWTLFMPDSEHKTLQKIIEGEEEHQATQVRV